ERRKRRALLRAVEPVLVVAEDVREGGAVVSVATRRTERRGAPRTTRLQRLQDLLVADAELLGELRDGRRAAEPRRQLGRRVLDAQRELLQVSGRADGPRLV